MPVCKFALVHVSVCLSVCLSAIDTICTDKAANAYAVCLLTALCYALCVHFMYPVRHTLLQTWHVACCTGCQAASTRSLRL